MSYTLDVYRGHVAAEKSILRLATYVTLFPQLIAGPIVRYKTVAEELLNRTHSFENFASGVNRFVLGLGKKVLLANQLGELSALAMSSQSPSIVLIWMGTLAFAMQIYFDFSGYSDMAIGLGRMFGFHFLENFNYPFIAKSITEFWSRWHISLGTWFKDYVYIPLGGNRTTPFHWYKNIAIVWFLTGIWHGASWNFVLWGLYFAVILVLEKLWIKSMLEALPKSIRHLYVIVIVNISFVIFNHTQFNEMYQTLKGLMGLAGLPLYTQETQYYLTSYAVILCLSLIGTTPLLNGLYQWMQKKTLWQKTSFALEPLVLSTLFLMVTAYLVDASFNPFLYFRF